MRNTIIGTAIDLVFANFIKLDSIGAHMLENTIGIARQTSNDPRWS